MIQEQQYCNKIINKLEKKYKHHNLSIEEEQEFLKQTKCYLCNNELINPVRYHCHLTGKYRGAACYI